MTNTHEEAPRVTLTGGIIAANLSSPHPFRFTDGNVLEACSDARSRALSLDLVDVESPGIRGTVDITLQKRMSLAVAAAITVLEGDPGVDIIVVPLMVLEALKASGADLGKCRVVRTADRITKVIHWDRWCR